MSIDDLVEEAKGMSDEALLDFLQKTRESRRQMPERKAPAKRAKKERVVASGLDGDQIDLPMLSAEESEEMDDISL